MDGPPFRCVVIDSGIHAAHPHVGRVASAVTVTAGSGEPRIADGAPDRIGHGTAVAAAILDHAPETELHVVRVFDDKPSAGIARVLAALHHALGLRPRVVNLSLAVAGAAGATELLPAFRRAAEAGVLIVLPRRDEGAPSRLAGLPASVAVEADWRRDRKDVLFGRLGGAPAAIASPFPRPAPGLPRDRNLRGISFAAANAAGVLLSRLPEIPNLFDRDLPNPPY